MTKTWILVADAHRARCFEQNASDSSLTELADFVSPHARVTSETSADRSGDAGKGHGRTGHAGTQFEPKTEAGAKERHSFARQLAEFLNKGVIEQRCSSLALIASGPMLGELRPFLSPAADKILHHSVATDLTHYQGVELKQRVHEALRPPG